VYGIGPIGFQHCSACGARWRCLLPKDPPPRRISLRAAALAGAAVLALAAGVAAYATTRTGNGPQLAAAAHGAHSDGSGDARPAPARTRYVQIVGPLNAARTKLRLFLDSAPPITPRAELDRRVAAFAVAARRADARLDRARWPAPAERAVQELIAADRKVTADLEGGVANLNQPGFGNEIAADGDALRTAGGRVRAALGLAAAPTLPDPRFPDI